MSDFRLQIVHLPTNQVAFGWQPGDRVETDLAEELARRVKAKGIGLFRSEAHVLSDLRQAFSEMLYELKDRV